MRLIFLPMTILMKQTSNPLWHFTKLCPQRDHIGLSKHENVVFLKAALDSMHTDELHAGFIYQSLVSLILMSYYHPSFNIFEKLSKLNIQTSP